MNQFSSKSNYASYIGASGPNRSMMNPYYMSPLVDPAVLSALLASNIMDPLSAMNYLNQVGSYQDILRQYQSNLSSLTNLTGGLNNPGTTMTGISNVSTLSTTSSSINTSSINTNIGNLSNLNNMTVQQLLSLSNSTASTTSRPTPMYHQTTSKTSTTMSVTKDRPSISITPVTTSLSQQQPHKTKPSSKQPSAQSDPLPVHIPKSLQISPTKSVLHSSNTAQVSLLKPSVIQQVKTSPPKQVSAPQIRVSKSLIEPQPAHNSSLSHSPLKSGSGGGVSNPAVVPQVAHTAGPMGAPVVMKNQSLPMNLPASRSGTSLQHKLLSKKNSQRQYPQTSLQNLMRKTKVASKTMPVLPGNFPNLLNAMPSGSPAMAPPFIPPPELSGISVSAVTQPTGMKATKYHGYKKSSVKSKATTATTTTTAVDVSSSLPASFSQGSSVEALSMLSQLKQHSHLEIIPQQKTSLKPSMDYSKGLSSSVTVVPQKIPTSETLRPSTTAECMPMYDMPRGKPPANISAKKTDKLSHDSVEIITLDD